VKSAGENAAADGQTLELFGKGSGGALDFGDVGGEDFANGGGDLFGVFGDEADGLSIEEEAAFLDGGFDDRVLLGGDAGEFGEFEVGGAEAEEERDEAVGVAATDGDVGSAELAPTGSESEVELLGADAAEEVRVRGGATSTDSGEGASLSDDVKELDKRIGVGQRWPVVFVSLVHLKRDQRAETRNAGQIWPAWSMSRIRTLLPD